MKRLLWKVGIYLALKGGGENMVTVYVTLVIAGVENGGRSFESVPAGLKKAVENELRAIGLGTDGKPLEG